MVWQKQRDAWKLLARQGSNLNHRTPKPEPR
jgi:hypothetical protein